MPKGLSAKEKRERLLTVYRSAQCVYTEKEVEKAGHGAGITLSSVKDINQMLIDDNLVDSEKIGSSYYFWSFPSKKAQELLNQREGYEKAVDEVEKRIDSLKRSIESEASQRNECDERAKRLKTYSALGDKLSVLEAEIEALKDQDPAEIERIEKGTELCRSSANRWTDNIFEIKSYICKKRGMSKREATDLLKRMGVSPELDYLEEAK